MPIVTLAEVKLFLDIASATHDGELAAFIDAATAPMEHMAGVVEQRSFTDRYSGAGQTELTLRHHPVISITSVTENGVTLTAADYAISDGGVLIRVAGSLPRGWHRGVNNITVTYLAGRSPIPEHLKLAAKIIIGHLWETQLGTAGARSAVPDSDLSVIPGFSFAIPRRAIELLQPDMTPGV